LGIAAALFTTACFRVLEFKNNFFNLLSYHVVYVVPKVVYKSTVEIITI
jgi:hypothetical protein